MIPNWNTNLESACCQAQPTSWRELEKCHSCNGMGCRDCKGSSLTNPKRGICSKCKQEVEFAYPWYKPKVKP